MTRRRIDYFYRGQIERFRMSDRGRNPWQDGYSENGQNGMALYPWLTYRECQADAKARDGRAVFHRETTAVKPTPSPSSPNTTGA